MTSSRDLTATSETSSALRVASAGQVIAERYLIECEVGRGGMGVVYRAQHVLTARPVALKLLGERAGNAERAVNEARSAASLRHPNVVDVLDVDLHEGAPFLVMELLTGEVLSPSTPGGRDISRLLGWMLPILGAVAALHEHGYVHGDLKPANVLLHRQGSRIVPKLIDFGLATSLFDRSLLATPVYGTPRYMAPERAAAADLTVQADVWSLGMTLLDCLAGRAATPGSLAKHRPDLPVAIVDAIECALRPDLHLRHATIRALARSLVEACWQANIALLDDLDPIALPELASWRREARQRPVLETHTVEAQQPGEQRRATSSPRWSVLALLVVAALASWASWRHLATTPATHARVTVVGSPARARTAIVGSPVQVGAAVVGSPAQTRAALFPALSGVPALTEPAAQPPSKHETYTVPRSKLGTKRERAALLAPVPESEDEDITNEWK